MAVHNEFGKKAEKMAVEYLKRKGFVILETNYRYDRAEVDIIAEDGERLVAIEVKARSSIFYGDPQSFVNKRKIRLMVKAMDHYINENELDTELRFDIVAVIKGKNVYDIKHIEDAFYHF